MDLAAHLRRNWGWYAAGGGALVLLGVSRRQQPFGITEPLSPEIASFLGYVELALGQPYVWGAHSWGAYDCSGLISWALAESGIEAADFRLTAEGLRGYYPAINDFDALPGDLVFYSTGGPADHVEVLLDGGRVAGARKSVGLVGVFDLPNPARGGKWGVIGYGRVTA